MHGGRRSLKITARMKEGATFGNASGGDLFKSFGEKGYDKLYARYYCRFSVDSGCLSHFVTLGGLTPPTPWPRSSRSATSGCNISTASAAWPHLESTCWFDDIVLATEYTGPRVEKPSRPVSAER